MGMNDMGQAGVCCDSSWDDLDAFNSNRHMLHELYGQWAIPIKSWDTRNHHRRSKTTTKVSLFVDRCCY